MNNQMLSTCAFSLFIILSMDATDAEWVEVRRCMWLHEAELFKSVLDAAGIESMIPNEYTLGVQPLYANMLGGSRVLVRMAFETIQGTLRQTRLTNESAGYRARREEPRLAEIDLMQRRQRVAELRRSRCVEPRRKAG